MIQAFDLLSLVFLPRPRPLFLGEAPSLCPALARPRSQLNWTRLPEIVAKKQNRERKSHQISRIFTPESERDRSGLSSLFDGLRSVRRVPGGEAREI